MKAADCKNIELRLVEASPWCQSVWELCTNWSHTLQTPPSHCFQNLFPEVHQGVQVLWAWAAHSPCLVSCNKCCTFLNHNLVSVDWLYCMGVSRIKLGSVTLIDRPVPGRNLSFWELFSLIALRIKICYCEKNVNCKLKQHIDNTAYLLEWLKSKNLKTWTVGKIEEQKELLLMASGNVKWYGHFGRQVDHFFTKLS